MLLYLVRHAEAVSPEVDVKRPLSQEGVANAAKMGRYLEKRGARVAEVRHSSKLRAAQTAEIVASELEDQPRLVGQQGLAPNDPVEPVARELQSHPQDLMIVSHLPFLPNLVENLLGTGRSPGSLSCPPAGCVILSRDPDGIWLIEDQIWPETLP
jgi:phosphohistidine phosphatase